MKYLVIALIVIIPSSKACSCRFFGPEKYYCSSDFMIKAKVTGNKEVVKPGDTCTGREYPCFRPVWYDLQVIEVFKANPKAKKLLENNPKIFADSFGAQCGVRFETGDTYIIGGGVEDNRLKAFACGYHQALQNFKWLEPQHKQFFAQKKYLATDCATVADN